MQTLKERYAQNNKNRLLHEAHKRKMLIIEAIEQAQLEKASVLIKKLENFEKLMPELKSSISRHIEPLRDQKFGGEVAKAVTYIASLERGFSQLGQVLSNFFGEEAFKNVKEEGYLEELLAEVPQKRKKFEALLEKLFSPNDGFWNKVKGFFKGESINVGEIKEAILSAKIITLKKVIQNFTSGPQADDMKKEVAAAVRASGAPEAAAGAPASGAAPEGEKPSTAPTAASGAPASGAEPKGEKPAEGAKKPDVEKLTQDVLSALKYGGRDSKRVVKKTLLWLDKNNKLKEAFEKGALKLVIDESFFKENLKRKT